MHFKVTICKGMGSVNCNVPAFHLEEDKKPFCFIQEKTPATKELEDLGFIEIRVVSDKEVKDHLKKISAMFNKKAKAQKIKELEHLKKTGGKETVDMGDGTILTIDHDTISSQEIRSQAEAEMTVLMGDESALDALADMASTEE